MALCDYFLCDVCGGKAFFDARNDWENYGGITVAALCRKCSKTHKLVVVSREGDKIQHEIEPTAED